MKRYGMLVGLRPEHFEAYKEYHAAVWPEVLAMIESCNIRNYTIYHHDGTLFASYEYHGTDHAADVAALDLAHLEPSSHPIALQNVLRPDVPEPSLDREEVLAAAPAVEDHRFRVPRIGGAAP